MGVVSGFLFRQNVRAGLEVPLRGFGGSFAVKQGPDEIVPFVAGGIGITPLLAQAPELDLKRLRLFWTLNAKDVGLAVDTMQRWQEMGPATNLFISSHDEISTAVRKSIDELREFGVEVITRRLLASDIEMEKLSESAWYLCTGTPLRKSLLEWLQGKVTIYEDFNY